MKKNYTSVVLIISSTSSILFEGEKVKSLKNCLNCQTNYVTTKRNPVLRRHPGTLNNSRCNSSSTEAGVLVANHLATARPLPKEVRRGRWFTLDISVP
ncbi:hypothetical protein AVEN_133162-1 [Araneus ventricosus]|uniref:Uncharacterized protein n=1 Tax=Araneus ventricosus TaxID=182803 RepID=A0A4Y2JJJ1_ARAVE|nr:hypothetical protein AVEN_133162-1 [Araneus ventricosus]